MIGVLVALGFVVGVGYFYRQNGNPLVAQQQSFNNLNNENNTEGVVDGFANPLGADESNASEMTPSEEPQFDVIVQDTLSLPPDQPPKAPSDATFDPLI